MMRKLMLTAAVALVCLLGLTRTAPAGDGCAPACCETPTKKVCHPVQETRKVTKIKYGEACEDFCVPRCSLSSGLFKMPKKKCCDEQPQCDTCNTCADGNCSKCGKVHTRKALILKVRTKEECVTKCVVVHEACETAKPCQPACAAPTCSTKTTIIECPSPPVAASPEKLPTAPKTDKKMPPAETEKK